MNLTTSQYGLFSPLNNTAHISLSSLWPIPRETFFVPDFTEHPKPHKPKHPPGASPTPSSTPVPPTVEQSSSSRFQQEDNENDVDDITFFHDFIAGGAAGSASVVVGHPFDTIKGTTIVWRDSFGRENKNGSSILV
jgi:Mitochondrial carrier protein